MMHARNFSEITDFRNIAMDFTELLSQPDNADIALEFPSTVQKYTGDIDEVASNLLNAQSECIPGERQQFVGFVGERAIGMSVIRFVDEVPDGVESTWPNISGFVCNPYRNNGIAKRGLSEELDVVEEQFGGNAWTRIKKQNAPSRRVATLGGFSLIGEDADGLIYACSSSK